MSLDLHSACAIGNFERVQDAVNKNEDLDQRNKGRKKTMLYCKRKFLFPLILTFLTLFNYLIFFYQTTEYSFHWQFSLI